MPVTRAPTAAGRGRFAWRTAARLLAAAALAGCAKPPEMTDRIAERFESGKNQQHWVIVRTGTCGPGTTAPTFPEGRMPRSMGEVLPRRLGSEAFRSGSLELTAVSGSRDAVPPLDECGVLLTTVLLGEGGVAYNGGDLKGDFEAEIGFRLMTPQSVLVVNIVFAAESKYIALFVPVAGQSAVGYTAPGKAAYMRRRYDEEMDNEPVELGSLATLALAYTRYRDTVEVRLNGRRLTPAGDYWPVSPSHFGRRFEADASQVWVYAEAGLGAGTVSTVRVESFLLREGRRSRLAEAVLWLSEVRWHLRRLRAGTRRLWELEKESFREVGRYLFSSAGLVRPTPMGAVLLPAMDAQP